LITGLFDRITEQYYADHPDAEPVAWVDPTTEINGQSLPGTLLPFTKTVPVVDDVIDGRNVAVNLGTREAGTRVAIHVHEAGGSVAFIIGGKGKLKTWTQGLDVFSHQVIQ
jgi:quercetin dioxygenase-like cupin family protein